MGDLHCSPGSHSHSDLPNWQPAKSPDEYLANCREGLETYSDRRMAALLGWSRIRLHRCILKAALPKALFERLLKVCRTSTEMANAAQVFFGADNIKQVECCPNCGSALRVRPLVGSKISKVIADYRVEGQRHG